LRNPLTTWAVLLPLGIMGMGVALAYFPAFAAFYLIFPVYAASCLIFHVYSRYRQVVFPLLILFAAYVPVFLVERLRERSWTLFLSPLPLAAGIALVALNTTPYSPAQQYYNQGYGLSQKAKMALQRGAEAEAGGFFRQASENYATALEIHPGYAEAANNLGTVYLQYLDNTAEAARLFRQAVESRPDYAEAQLNLGTALAGLNRPQEAEEWFKQALLVRPDYYRAIFNLAYLYQTEGRLSEAMFQYGRAEKLLEKQGRKEPILLYRVAECYDAMNNKLQAYTYFKLYVDAAEKHGDAPERLERARELRDKYEDDLLKGR
jgi:tetratricopeptide (TPR) repeat protein